MSATTAAADAAEPMQYLTFQLAGEQYAVGILQVREIIRYEAVTAVPTAPPAVRGVLNLRGSVVPVVDLAVRFGLAPTEVTRRTCIVIVETAWEEERTTLGVLVDSVSQVLDLSAADLAPPPAFGAGVHADYLRGMARQGARFALVLDLDRVLAHLSLTTLPSAPSAHSDAPAETAEEEEAGELAGAAAE